MTLGTKYAMLKFYTTQQGVMPMTISSHLSELKRKHDALSQRVEEAQRSPGLDGLKVVDLKKQKLRLKEEITKYAN